MNLKEAIEFHYKHEALVTIVLKRVQEPLEYGVAVCEGNTIKRFVEKPSWPEVFSDTVNTGIYVVDKSVLSMIPEGMFDFSKDLFPKILRNGGKICGYVSDGYWCDIGDTESYKKGCFDLLDKTASSTGEMAEKIEAGRRREFYGVEITNPVFIGENVEIRKGSKIGPYAIIEDNVSISEDCHIKYSIIKSQCILSKNTEVKGAILCNDVVTGMGVGIFEGAVVGAKSKIGDGAQIMPGSKIWPCKEISANEKISGDLIWGSVRAENKVENSKISFSLEEGINPTTLLRWGRAAGRFFSLGRPVLCSEGKKVTEIAKELFLAGMLIDGADIIDAGISSDIALMNYIRTTNKAGGVYFKKEGGKLVIDFLGGNGLSQTKGADKKLEKFFAEEQETVYLKKTSGNCLKFEGLDEYYTSELARIYHIPKTIAIGISGEGKKCNLLKNALLKCGADVVSFGKGEVNLKVKNGNLIYEDEKKEKIQKEDILALLSKILGEQLKEETVILPANFPVSCERILKENAANYLLTSEISQKISENNAVYFDEIAGALCIIKFLSEGNLKLSDETGKLPKVYYKKKEIFCDHKNKGKVMRFLIEENGVCAAELKEGVLIPEKEGAFVRAVPHKTLKSFSVFAEAFREEYAAEICDSLAKKVRELTEK